MIDDTTHVTYIDSCWYHVSRKEVRLKLPNGYGSKNYICDSTIQYNAMQSNATQCSAITMKYKKRKKKEKDIRHLQKAQSAYTETTRTEEWIVFK